MEREKSLFSFKLNRFENLTIVSLICNLGYQKTGNEFTVMFNGSKGHLSTISINCEGYQEDSTNIILIENYMTKRGKIMSKTVDIYYSKEKGIRVSI